MAVVPGYLFLLPTLLSPFTRSTQFFPDSFVNIEEAVNPELRQRYYASRPYWRPVDDGNDNYIEVPVDFYVDQLDREMTARKPLYSAIIENQAEKRVASGGSMKDKASSTSAGNPQHYDDPGAHGSSTRYDKRNAFRQLALNGARGFGK